LSFSVSGLTEAQRQDAEHFDAYWQKQFEAGRIDLGIPTDEEIWRRDLGRARRIAFEWLGDLRGKRVLELGCGPGDEAIMMARRGARVTALDIAPSSVQITRQRARASNVDFAMDVSCATAEALPFPPGEFDWVVGFGLLHHADSAVLGPEVSRVLRPGGHALFFEPLGANPLLEYARDHLPYRGKHHSLNDHPLQYDQIRLMGLGFRTTRLREFYLFSMISRAIGGEMSFPWLWFIDELLIERVPVVRRWCRYVLVEYVR
jgi:SAM-dependent methyltransferase